MTNYWPEGIDLTDKQSPLEILRDAQAEWESSSGGVLELILQEAESQAGYDMIIIHARHTASNRTASLFSVVSRKENPYPTRLQPKENELPNFFKKSHKTSNLNSLTAINSVIRQLNEEKWVNNEWVVDTPGELREKLEKIFNLGDIKSEILNLISTDVAQNDVDSGTREDVKDASDSDSPPSDEKAELG